MNLMEKTVHFTPELQVLKSQIEFLQILMDQVNELGEDFKLLYSDQALKILIHKGKQLIKECNDAVVRSTLSRYRKIPCYTKKFRRLDAELKRAESNLRFELCVQQIKKLPALNDGRNGRIRDPAKLIVTKILDKILSGESGRNNNKYNIKLPLLFYHDQRLKGKAGAKFVAAFVERAVEHMKDDQKEGDEKLQISFICNLSTTRERGENETVAAYGVLFVSSAKVAFCSFKPTLRLLSSDVNIQSLIKVVIPLEVLKDVEYDGDQKCIRVIAVDDQKFEFMNFRNYKVAKEGIQRFHSHPFALASSTNSLCLNSWVSYTLYWIQVFIYIFGKYSLLGYTFNCGRGLLLL
ncbi:uncharacterized protein LOC105435900 isoform X4 [Cucumis sativus]|uniref:uncharacterized protein LOC105435900 isoform X4 n=1 Tax=Cucumis sativus TaxID=3659 RepID=UPI0012F50D8E|nr:uncharacterized protein LOC105435900 isoform X4 [Cucumis sativus]